MDEVSACAQLLAQHAPLNSPTVGKKNGQEKGLRSDTNIYRFKQGFSTGNAAADIQLGGKSQYLHRHVELMMVFYMISYMCCKCSNAHRCTSFPPINSQTGINKTHQQHAGYVKWLSCLLLNQLCNYLKDVLIVACSTLNISRRFSSSPSKIDWINQSELWVNRRPANQWCVREFVSQPECGWGRSSKHTCMRVDMCTRESI